MLRLVLFISSVLAVGLTESTLSDNDDNEPYYRHIGCFKDTWSRAMPDLLGTWSGRNAIKECAKASWKKGYKVFGVQHFGECWSGVNAALTYDKYGHSNGCSSDGVGGRWASDVYAFVFCPPGYTNTMDNATCQPCPVDTYEHNKSKCQPCGGLKKTWGRKAVANEEQCTDENPIKVPSFTINIVPNDVTPGLIVANFTGSNTSGSLVIPPLTYTISGVTKTPLQTRTTNVTSGDIESCSQPTTNSSFPFCIYKHNGSIAINQNFNCSEGDEFVISINVSDSGNDTIGKIVNPNGRVTIACVNVCKDVKPLYQKARNACPKTNITVQTHESKQKVVDTTNIHAIHEVHVTNITGNGCNSLNITIKQGLRMIQTDMAYFSDISGNQSLVYRFDSPIIVTGPVLNITLLSNGCITSCSLTLVTVPKHPENCSVTGWTCLDGVFNWKNSLNIGKCGSDPDKLRMRYGHCVVKPTIISGPASSSVASETQVTLSCGISSPIPAKITWYRETGEIVNSSITMNVYHQGYYWCEASNRYGTTRSRKALLVVTDHFTSLIRFKAKENYPNSNQNKDPCKPFEHISRYLSSKDASRDYKHRSTCKHWNWDNKLGAECVIYGKKKTQDEDANNYYKNLVGILTEGAKKNKIEGLKIDWKSISVKDAGICLRETTGQSNIKGYFIWSSARIGETRTFNCPYGNSSATRRCGGNFNTGAEWNTPDDDNCNYKSKKTQELNKLSQIKLNSGNVKEVAKNFTKLFKSGSSRDMSEADANLAADMVDKILSVEDRLNETAGLVVEIIDFFMEISKLVLARSTNATSRIIKALDKLTRKVPLEEGKTSRILNTTNVVIQATEVTRSSFKGITFGVKKKKEGSSTVIADADQSDIFVRLPSTILEKSIQSSSRIGFIYYANNKLFQPSPQDENEEAQLLSNEVISGSVYNELMQNLKDPLRLKFQVLKDSDGNPGTPTSCVFWEEHQRQWSSLGCSLHKTDDTIGNPVECHCNHMTSFSVVFAFGSGIPFILVFLLERTTFTGQRLLEEKLNKCPQQLLQQIKSPQHLRRRLHQSQQQQHHHQQQQQ